MDISANFNFYNSKNKAVGYIGFSIFNIYNRKNDWYKEYSIVEGNVIETNINYLGFTPNLTLSFKLR
jgi:ferric enterobactin receptor